MKTYSVSVMYGAPLIGGRIVSVHADSKTDACIAALRGQPRGSTATARLVDMNSYHCDFVDSVRGFLELSSTCPGAL